MPPATPPAPARAASLCRVKRPAGRFARAVPPLEIAGGSLSRVPIVPWRKKTVSRWRKWTGCEQLGLITVERRQRKSPLITCLFHGLVHFRQFPAFHTYVQGEVLGEPHVLRVDVRLDPSGNGLTVETERAGSLACYDGPQPDGGVPTGDSRCRG